MIQINEIRVGNYFHHNDNWNGLNHKGIFKWTRDDWYYLGECTIDLENVSAIPLTEEILLKCGFEKDGNFYYIKYFKSIYLSRPWLEANHLLLKTLGGECISKIKHLHQLQNIYFELTSEELNIEL